MFLYSSSLILIYFLADFSFIICSIVLSSIILSLIISFSFGNNKLCLHSIIQQSLSLCILFILRTPKSQLFEYISFSEIVSDLIYPNESRFSFISL